MRELPSPPSSVTVIKDCANRYFLSFVVEVEPVNIDAKNQSIGIDYCGTEHDRDENAAKNINKVGISIATTRNGHPDRVRLATVRISQCSVKYFPVSLER